MNNFNIKKAANILYNSRINLQRIKELPDDCIPESSDEAYAIQSELTIKYLLSDKESSVIGKKIGCTNKAAQAQINVKESFFGNMFSNNISPSDSIVDSKNYFNPFVEPEFSFVINNELNISGAPYNYDEIYNSISSVLPSIELVDSRFKDWTSVGVNNLIADNAVHAHWIFGKENNNLNYFNFKDHTVDLFINEKLIEKGNSNNVMGNPINSLTWLINKLAVKGETLPKNYFVSTGTCTPAIPIFKGDRVTADFGSLGIVSFIYK